MDCREDTERIDEQQIDWRLQLFTNLLFKKDVCFHSMSDSYDQYFVHNTLDKWSYSIKRARLCFMNLRCLTVVGPAGVEHVASVGGEADVQHAPAHVARLHRLPQVEAAPGGVVQPDVLVWNKVSWESWSWLKAGFKKNIYRTYWAFQTRWISFLGQGFKSFCRYVTLNLQILFNKRLVCLFKQK